MRTLNLADKAPVSEKIQFSNPFIALVNAVLPKKPTARINSTKSLAYKRPIIGLAEELEQLLREREWFVTGHVKESLFSKNFTFRDPNVELIGIKNYADGVRRLFDQKCSKVDIISVVVNETQKNTITVTWRLSGAVNIGLGLKLKPYLVYTDYKVDPDDGLIVSQEDRFSIPGYDIVLSALFPFLIPFLSAPAPSVTR